MSMPLADSGLTDSAGRTALYRAAQDGHESAVNAILTSADNRNQDLLEVAETVNGWTPLFIACVNGRLPVVKLLLEAGAKHRLCDRAGWTEKEHAVFGGHMKVAELLAAHEAEDPKAPASSGLPRMRVVRPGETLRCAWDGQTRIATSLEPPKIVPNHIRMQGGRSTILLSIGPSNTRNNLKPIEVTDQSLYQSIDGNHKTKHEITIKAVDAGATSVHSIELPMLCAMTNDPLQFEVEEPDKIKLVFELSRSSSTGSGDTQVIGTGIALLKSLRHGLGPKRETLIRDYTIPILRNGHMNHLGSVTFNVLVITPFQPPTAIPRASPGFWQKGSSTQLVGHRGSGANSTARTSLQIGENTVQSFLAAISLGASCVEFDVQLTKDHVPVIFHDFLVMETGGDVPLHTLTFDQFMHLSRSQASKSGTTCSSQAGFIEKNSPCGGLRLKPRSRSVNTRDDYRSHELIERMRYTEEGMHNNIKGNLRGLSIQEPSSTLEQLLIQLPEVIDFNLEIKHPMLWEAEDRGMDLHAIELNFFVDTILTIIFRLCGNRNITLSSFSPEVCILLACKQEAFPVLFINKAGSVPVGDVRAGSLKGAIEFAKAWDLAGIVMLSDPFVMCPRLLTYAKDSGLVVGSYGNLNDEPDCALVRIINTEKLREILCYPNSPRPQIQAEAGLDAIMTNKIRLISETLAKTGR